MKIFVQGRPSARRELVEELGKNRYRVWVKEPPEKGLANKAIIYALSKHLSLPQIKIKIVAGFSSRNKTLIVGE